MKCLKRLVPLVVAGALSASVAGTAYSAGKIVIDNTRWISIGAGLRTDFTSVDNATGVDDDDFSLSSIRLYVNGQIHKNVGFEFNTRKDGSNVAVMDGIAKFDYNGVNFWMGRFLPPSGRSNMSGPYYQGDYSPGLSPYSVAGYGLGNGGVGAGRDDGAAVWGMAAADRLKWKLGLFEGMDNTGAAPGQKDSLMFAGRLQYNFWDTEAGYYNASTYFGGKDILAIGIVFQSQSDAASSAAANAGDYTLVSIDGLIEKKLGNSHVATGEFAWTDVDRDSQGTALAGENDIVEGDGYTVLGGYQIMQWKATARVTSFSSDTAGVDDIDRTDIALHYIIDGHNANISLTWTDNINNVAVDANEADAIVLGVQLQI